ncbi:MAG: hypothetical protein WBC53_03025 [Phycisphaerae bacterium]
MLLVDMPLDELEAYKPPLTRRADFDERTSAFLTDGLKPKSGDGRDACDVAG